MIRTQISLEADQYRYLKALSHRTGESLSALLREAVEQLRARDAPVRERALALIGAFEAESVDVAEHHDEHFARAIED